MRGPATTGGLLKFGTESIAVPVLRWFPLIKGILDWLSPEDPRPMRWWPGTILRLLRDVGTLDAEDVLLSPTKLPTLLPPLAGVRLRRPKVSVQLEVRYKKYEFASLYIKKIAAFQIMKNAKLVHTMELFGLLTP